MTETASPGRIYRFNPIIRVQIDVAPADWQYTTSPVTGTPHFEWRRRARFRPDSGVRAHILLADPSSIA
jgi:hypothetical protein